MHNLDLIITLSSALVAALVLGYITQRFLRSPILGYLLAGVVVGPHTPGFVADMAIASQLAEIGVVLLMFGVGLHFHAKDLLAVKRIAIPGAIIQSLVATMLGMFVAYLFGWELGAGLVFGIGLSVASTVVLMRALNEQDQLHTVPGHIAVGWLVVEDILTVLALVLLPAFIYATENSNGGMTAIGSSLGIALFKVASFGALMFIVGARVIPWILTHVARTRSEELFTLTILVLALAIAAGAAQLFDVSMALGAFLAGMVVGRSTVSHQVAANALPMRDAFAVLFFVSVGMLFDWRLIVEEPLLVLGALVVILIGKPVIALLIMVVFGYTVRAGLVVAIGLAQIGEFSFILAELARQLKVLPVEGHSVLVAGALISITLNPFLFRSLGSIESWLQGRKSLWAFLNYRAEKRSAAINERAAAQIAADDSVRAVVVGYGPVGLTVASMLRDFDLRPVIVDMNVDTVSKLVAEGNAAIYGDARRSEVLKAAGIEKAKYLIITLPDLVGRIPVIIAARELNPTLKIMVRAHYLREQAMLDEVGVDFVCYEEAEAAVALTNYLLREIGAKEQHVEEKVKHIRDDLAPGKTRIVFTSEAPRPPRISDS